MYTRYLFLFLSLFFSILCYGQANDVALSVGGIFSPNSVGVTCAAPPASVDCLSPNAAKSGIAIEGTFAHRLLNFDVASLHLELPLMGAPNRAGLAVGNFSSAFFTPALRVKFSLPVISPFLSVGGGFAHFSPKNSFTSSDTKGTFQVGGGVDMTTPIPHIGFRAEVREFRTGAFASTQHNIFAGGGIVLKF